MDCNMKSQMTPFRCSNVLISSTSSYTPATPSRNLFRSATEVLSAGNCNKELPTPLKGKLAKEQVEWFKAFKSFNDILVCKDASWSQKIDVFEKVGIWILSEPIREIFKKKQLFQIHLVIQLIDKYISPQILIHLLDLRSQLCRATCKMLSSIAFVMGDFAKNIINTALPVLIKNLARPSKVFFECANSCILSFLKYASLSVLLGDIIDGCMNKHPMIREKCFNYLYGGISKKAQGNDLGYLSFYGEKLFEVLKDGASAPQSDVRKSALNCLKNIEKFWPRFYDEFSCKNFSKTTIHLHKFNNNENCPNGHQVKCESLKGILRNEGNYLMTPKFKFRSFGNGTIAANAMISGEDSPYVKMAKKKGSSYTLSDSGGLVECIGSSGVLDEVVDEDKDTCYGMKEDVGFDCSLDVNGENEGGEFFGENYLRAEDEDKGGVENSLEIGFFFENSPKDDDKGDVECLDEKSGASGIDDSALSMVERGCDLTLAGVHDQSSVIDGKVAECFRSFETLTLDGGGYIAPSQMCLNEEERFCKFLGDGLNIEEKKMQEHYYPDYTTLELDDGALHGVVEVLNCDKNSALDECGIDSSNGSDDDDDDDADVLVECGTESDKIVPNENDNTFIASSDGDKGTNSDGSDEDGIFGPLNGNGSDDILTFSGNGNDQNVIFDTIEGGSTRDESPLTECKIAGGQEVRGSIRFEQCHMGIGTDDTATSNGYILKKELGLKTARGLEFELFSNFELSQLTNIMEDESGVDYENSGLFFIDGEDDGKLCSEDMVISDCGIEDVSDNSDSAAAAAIVAGDEENARLGTRDTNNDIDSNEGSELIDTGTAGDVVRGEAFDMPPVVENSYEANDGRENCIVIEDVIRKKKVGNSRKILNIKKERIRRLKRRVVVKGVSHTAEGKALGDVCEGVFGGVREKARVNVSFGSGERRGNMRQRAPAKREVKRDEDECEDFKRSRVGRKVIGNGSRRCRSKNK